MGSWRDWLKSAMPIVGWLPRYRSEWLWRDVIAGLTLAAYAVPVSVAFASLAGLPPQTGLYGCVVGGLTYAAFGTSKQLAVGPTSAISILIGSAIGALADGDALRHIQLASAVAVLAGLIGVIAWALRLGQIANFVSETVLSGFKLGAGLVIASTQLPKLFGVSSEGRNFFRRIIDLVHHRSETNPAALGLGVGALVLLILGERLLPKRPVALIVVAMSIVVMSLFPLESHGVRTTGAIPAGLPQVGWPVVRWNEVDNLLPVAMACFLLAYVESISVVRTFSLKHQYAISADQELLGLGLANFAAGIAQAYPLAGGMSQSAVNEKGGARTPMALVVASGVIAAVLVFLTGLMRNLPDPVLAAVVLVAITGLIRVSEIRHLYRASKTEFHVAMVATIGVLAFGILKGVLLAAVFSLLLLLKQGSHPRVTHLGRVPGTGRFADMARYPICEAIPEVLVLRIESGLFYFNTENVKNKLLDDVQKHGAVKQLVLDLSTSANMDLAGPRMLRELQQQLSRLGISLALAEVHGDVRDILRVEELDKHIHGVTERLTIMELIERGTDKALPVAASSLGGAG